MSVNLKGADKEPPTEEIYITETLQAPQAENTEQVTKTVRAICRYTRNGIQSGWRRRE